MLIPLYDVVVVRTVGTHLMTKKQCESAVAQYKLRPRGFGPR